MKTPLVQMCNAALPETFHQGLDLGIDQRFAAADGNHGRVAFVGRQTFLQRPGFERRGILANPAQPVQVDCRCSGSNCNTNANFGVRRSVASVPGDFDRRASGKRMVTRWRLGPGVRPTVTRPPHRAPAGTIAS